MAATDPTNARLRDFDIPVIMPRVNFIPLDDSVGYVFTGELSHATPATPWQPAPGGVGEAG